MNKEKNQKKNFLAQNCVLLMACLINGGMTSSERFFHQTRQKIAGILCIFQDFLTQSGGKRSAVWAF
ncbi:MAG: hypothetical protein HFF67_00425 [Oscillospiraceae bacterium]|nr:hypothetical protein [Oscillospiraceae bacterium]